MLLIQFLGTYSPFFMHPKRTFRAYLEHIYRTYRAHEAHVILTDGPEKKSRTQYKKKPLIGCMCPARHILVVKPDGSVSVTFQGHHNHDVQEEYAVNYVNPVKVCQ